MAKIEIIVGSVTGNALHVAHAAGETLGTLGHSWTASMTYVPEHITTDPNSILLVCTSTTGAGDLPPNILPLHQYLTTVYPRIAGRHYNVITLGDSSYPTFAQAGQTMDEAFAELGAVRLGEPLIIDAILSDNFEQDACLWIAEWASLLPAPSNKNG